MGCCGRRVKNAAQYVIQKPAQSPETQEGQQVSDNSVEEEVLTARAEETTHTE